MDIVVDSAPEKKATKLVMEILKRAPVIHVFCNGVLKGPTAALVSCCPIFERGSERRWGSQSSLFVKPG
jgi:hypothetical protein